MIVTKRAQQVRDNLWFSLKDIAQKWYTSELSDNERRMMRMIMSDEEELSEWIILLLERFRESTNVVLQNLLKERYTIRDAANRRESREYAQKILRTARNVKISVSNQLNQIYNNIDMKIRVDDLRRLKKDIILNSYLKKLNEFKYD